MNMNSISDPTYRNINEQLCKAYEIAGNNSMKKAADEVASSSPTHESGIPLVCAKVDGAWQKSLKRLSKHCKQCQIWEIPLH